MIPNAIRESIKASMDPKKRRKAALAVLHSYRNRKKDLSTYDLGSAVRDAVYSESPAGQAAAAAMPQEESSAYQYWYVKDIYPVEMYAVICVGYDLHFKVPFSVGDGDKIIISPKEDWTQVVQKWVPTES